MERLREGNAPGLVIASATQKLRRLERSVGKHADGTTFSEAAHSTLGRSLREAINGMCKECIYDAGAAGSAAVQIELCTAYECPLWYVRPVRTGERSAYSRSVRGELGMTKEEADWRWKHPRARPPWAEERRGWGTREGGDREEEIRRHTGEGVQGGEEERGTEREQEGQLEGGNGGE